jgi:phosphorylase kinase alpha/beta subunit
MKNIRCNSIAILKGLLDKKTGLPIAAGGKDYGYCWIRDSYYIMRPFLKIDQKVYKKGYESLCKYISTLDEKYDSKTDWLIKKGRDGVNNMEFIHPRFYADSLNEITSEWGNTQVDSLGYLILGLAEAKKSGMYINGSAKCIDTLLNVLDAIRYWDCPDSGHWEENVELHSSSIGIVVDAISHLKEVAEHPHIENLLNKGREALTNLLPRESPTKRVDLAQAAIACMPFNTLPEVIRDRIVDDISYSLEREHGAIRYHGDTYYQTNSKEMEWTFWFAYKGLYYSNIGDHKAASNYLGKLVEIYKENNGNIPEGYVDGNPNPNTPLGWTVALMIELIDRLWTYDVEST